jgi:hypothetical protein
MNFAESYFYRVPDGQTLELPVLENAKTPATRRRAYNKIFRNDTYASVISLTILREVDDQVQVLAGPRNPATNPTHPNVISVPTQRVTPLLATGAAMGCEVKSQTKKEQVFARRWRVFDSADEMDADIVGHIVASAIGRKVGFEQLLVRRTNDVRISLESFTLGQSLVDYDAVNQIQTIEAIGMLNAAVHVPPDTERPQPVSYSSLKWFDIEEFQRGYREKDTLGMFPEFGLDALEMCVHGVCMATTSAVLQRGIQVAN